MNTPDRLQRLRQKLAEQKLEAILIASPHNRYYLSGFSGSAGYLLITPDRAILATDFRYIEQAGREAPDYTVFKLVGELIDWFPRLVTESSVRRLAFESEHITFALHQQLRDALAKAQVKIRLLPVAGVVESLRMVKEPEEIKFITRAVEITDAAFSYINGKMKLGMTELQVAWEIEKFMREHASQTVPFDIIVASGPNAALPHAKPTSRPIGMNEPVVIDIGARFGGYTSDLTRTLCLGPDDTFNKLYDITRRAQMAAIAGVREGMTGTDADSLARSIIEQEGYGPAFGHGMGHGIGLETHEQPRVGLRSPDRLRNGMVFTIEPGIYLSGWGGIRIEDDVVLENGRARGISQTAR